MVSEPETDESRSRLARTLLALVGVTSLFFGSLSIYARDTLFDSDAVGSIAGEALKEDEVRGAMVNQLVDQLVEYDQELLVFRPVLEVIVDAILQSNAFVDVVRFAAADLHATVFTEKSDTLIVELTDLVLFTKVSLAKLDPELAAKIPDDVTNGLVTLRSGEGMVDAAQAASIAGTLAFVLPLIALACLAGFVWLSPSRRRGVFVAGLSTIAVGVALIAFEAVARLLFVQLFDNAESEGVGLVLWDLATRSLSVTAIVVGGVGAFLATMAVLGTGDVDLRSKARSAAEFVSIPDSDRSRALWGLAAVIIGVIVAFNADEVVTLIAVLFGVVLFVVGANQLLVGVTGESERMAVGQTADDLPVARSLYRWGIGGLIAVALIAVGLVAIRRSGGDDQLAGSGGPGCNGSVLLCDRTVDQVAFATTHNSMAAANDGFTGAYQTVGIVPQLDDGYRGFLIDAYFGFDDGGFVITDRAPVTSEEREQLVADLGEAAVLAAESLRESAVTSGVSRDVYLCHSFCEWGAVLMETEFVRIREWLEANPREVLIFVIQDEGPKEEDVGDALEKSGLDSYLHSQEVGAPWPTLDEMIDSGRRIWVSAENSAGEEAWYHDAFTHVQDTPFSQPDIESFTCERNRGKEDSPLLLVNHWLSPVSPTAADMANTRSVLTARIEDCDQEREQFANLIAVDFSDRGDVIEFVDELNGVAAPSG